MTTSHKPTYHPAIGRANAGGYRYDAPRAQFSSRDMATHMTMKVRGDIVARDQQQLKEKLMESENRHKQAIRDERARQGLLADDDDDDGPRGAAASAGDAAASDSAAAPAVDLSQFDDEDDDVAAAAAAAARSGGGGGGGGGGTGEESSDDDDDDDSDDEDAELARELDLIRREREQARLRAAEAEAAEAEAAATAALKSNPLMPTHTFGNDTPFGGAAAAAAAAASNGSAGVKRHWSDDVVFKNQSKGDLVPKHKKRFINDTIRSDFHRSFINKYVK